MDLKKKITDHQGTCCHVSSFKGAIVNVFILTKGRGGYSTFINISFLYSYFYILLKYTFETLICARGALLLQMPCFQLLGRERSTTCLVLSDHDVVMMEKYPEQEAASSHIWPHYLYQKLKNDDSYMMESVLCLPKNTETSAF